MLWTWSSRSSWRIGSPVLFAACTAWLLSASAGPAHAGDEQSEAKAAKIEQARAAMKAHDAGADHLARAVFDDLVRDRADSKAPARRQRCIELAGRVSEELLDSAKKWNRAVVAGIAEKRGVRLPGASSSASKEELAEFPKKVYERHREDFPTQFDMEGLSASERGFLQEYYRFRLAPLLTTIRDKAALPSSDEDQGLPIVNSLIVLPVLTFDDPHFIVHPDEFLPEWCKRPYYVTKLVEFCLLVAKNKPAAIELDKYLAKLTTNPDDDYEGHYHEHFAMIYRRNGMLSEAAEHISEAMKAAHAAGMPVSHQVILRNLLVEGYERTKQFDLAGDEAFNILSAVGGHLDRRSCRGTVDRMIDNYTAAERTDLIGPKLDALLAGPTNDASRPVLLQRKWSWLRQQGEAQTASEVLRDMTRTYPNDEQTGRCLLDVAKNCLGAGQYDAFELIANQIINNFSNDSVSEEAAELLTKLETVRRERAEQEK